MEELEIWIPVLGYENFYEVSSFGNVRSKHNYRSGQNLKQCKDKARMSVALHGIGRQRTVSVHVIVLESFVCKRPKGKVCCHNDGDFTNNNLKNIRWGTPYENTQDSLKHGTFPIGQKQGSSVLLDSDILQIRQMIKRGVPHKIIASEYNVCKSAISHISTGRNWKHI